MTKKHIMILFVLLLGIGIGVIGYNKWNSPERALAETLLDVKKDGMAGLEKHLTEQSREAVESIQDISDDSLISNLLLATSAGFLEEFLKSKLSEIDWSLLDVMRGKKYAEAVIKFDYKSMITGTIGIRMEKTEGKWMISGVGNPSIDEVNLK